ncbi:hypothetical protein NEOLEDRAFT_1179179 [Neolentinus lepideus HHB14362 ss-1]|uniref:Nuclear segregation protein Bfr1 n=1 Tax=Neolentinus lepideus HHB14362 ss-1 TaxID=1314782 RepID=A0A165S085_9AGAM|nr:hypothetical protein NEOLEDRAFT_1179179 [Neolentinus lepideus HHB14362 ss-1]
MAPKTKAAPANGTAPKAKPAKATPSTSGTSTPVPAKADAVQDAAPTSGFGKPDKAAYDAEQAKLKTEIDAVQAKLNAIKDKIGLTSRSNGVNDRRTQLRSELDSLRAQQGGNKATRGKVLDQLKALQDGVQKKVKDLQAAKTKVPFKTITELEAHIKNLEKQVESGNLKLADEKRALQEISQLKRARRTVEGFQAEQDSIDTDRAAADELRKQLDDPEAKAISERYDAIKTELDALQKEGDEAYANRSKLSDERTTIQKELDGLWAQKKEATQLYRDANDRHWQKVNEDRARRAERLRAQRAAEEDEKKQKIVERLREEAAIPAFQTQIEDCQTLIDYFSGNSTTAAFSTVSLPAREEVVGVPKLELRKVETDAQEGMVVRKKKGEDDESYFVGGKAKKGKKGNVKHKTNGAEEANGSTSSQFNLPFGTLTALLQLSIPPPSNATEVPRVVEDLKTKKAWFEANQNRVTAENIAKAEAEIQRLTGKRRVAPGPDTEATPPNDGGEMPSEPAHTPQVTDVPSLDVPGEEVVERLESVQEDGDAPSPAAEE